MTANRIRPRVPTRVINATAPSNPVARTRIFNAADRPLRATVEAPAAEPPLARRVRAEGQADSTRVGAELQAIRTELRGLTAGLQALAQLVSSKLDLEQQEAVRQSFRQREAELEQEIEELHERLAMELDPGYYEPMRVRESGEPFAPSSRPVRVRRVAAPTAAAAASSPASRGASLRERLMQEARTQVMQERAPTAQAAPADYANTKTVAGDTAEASQGSSDVSGSADATAE
jgi:hypothetical protein